MARKDPFWEEISELADLEQVKSKNRITPRRRTKVMEKASEKTVKLE